MKRIITFLVIFASMCVAGPLIRAEAGQSLRGNGQHEAKRKHVGFPGGPTFTTIDVPGATFTGGRDVTPALDSFVGKYTDTAGVQHGFLMDMINATFTTIDFPGSTRTAAEGINALGDIVGVYRAADGTKDHGFILSAGEFTSIDFPDSSNTWATAINDLGDIVGTYCDATAAPCPIISGVVLNNRGYLLSEGKFTPIDFPGATVTQVWKISSGGDMVGGYEDAAGIFHGFLLRDGEFSTIDFPGAVDTAALGINSDGDIVGFYCPVHCDPIRGIGHHGFVLRDGEFSTIDFPGAQFINPFSITPCGDIAGGYRDFSGKNHGFLISTVEDCQ